MEEPDQIRDSAVTKESIAEHMQGADEGEKEKEYTMAENAKTNTRRTWKGYMR